MPKELPKLTDPELELDNFPYLLEHIRTHVKPPYSKDEIEHGKYGDFLGVKFLQENGMTTRQLVSSVDDIEHLVIRVGDFTENGLLFYRTIYLKYEDAMARNINGNYDLSKKRILDKALLTWDRNAK